MSLPTAVFLDTNILEAQNFNFASTAVATFIPAAKKHSLKFLLAAPIEGEITRHMRERARDAVKALEDVRKRVPFLAMWKHFPPKAMPHLTEGEVIRVAAAAWDEFLQNFSTVKLDYSGVDLATVMRWYERIAPPFQEGKKRKEFPDAFAIAILEHYARETSSVIAVVSDDPDFKRACDRFSSLLYFKSLPALTELLLSDEADLDAIRSAIQANVGLIEEAAMDETPGFIFRHVDRAFNIRRSKVLQAIVSDLRVVALGVGECTVTFEGEYESEHILEWDYSSPYEEPQEEEGAVYQQTSMSATAKVKFDERGNITEVTTFELDDNDTVMVDQRPRRRW